MGSQDDEDTRETKNECQEHQRHDWNSRVFNGSLDGDSDYNSISLKQPKRIEKNTYQRKR